MSALIKFNQPLSPQDMRHPVMFLDYDQILQPHQYGALERIAHLESILHFSPSMKLVLMSELAENASLFSILSSFSDNVKPRLESLVSTKHHTKLELIKEYLLQTNASRSWIVLDISPDEYSENCEELYLMQTMNGISDIDVQNLKRIVRNL